MNTEHVNADQMNAGQMNAGRVRPVRDCAHPVVHHHHGTRTAYVFDRCRCIPCSAANTTAQRARARAIAYGQWQPYIDAQPARAHLHKLIGAGIGLKQVAALTEIPYGTLSRLTHGDTTTGPRPTRRIRPHTAQRILATGTNPNNRAGRARVDATGTRRRIQALAANGWTPTQLAKHLHPDGRDRGCIRRLLTQTTVTAATAAAISVIYEQLWDKPPPTRTATEQRAVTKTREDAAKRGWPPPMAWDNIDTDTQPPVALAQQATTARGGRAYRAAVDEVAITRATDGDHLPLTVEERDEVIRRLSAQGLSIRKIADRIHTSKRTVERRRRATNTAAA